MDEQFIKNPENDQNNYHDTASTEPCINESPAQKKNQQFRKYLVKLI